MTIFESLLIALALSVDALVCATIYGKCHFDPKLKLKYALIIALCFGFFQFIMPIIGYIGGEKVQNYIANFDHWIAFALLAIVSAKMLKDCFENNDDNHGVNCKRINVITISALSIATSIDALALGFSVGILNAPILILSIIIGTVCFITSFSGFMVGQYLSKFKSLDKKLNIFGALVLLFIGARILNEHNVL